MGWADKIIDRLIQMETVTFRPTGRSMEPLIKSGQQVTCEPVTGDTELKIGDIVLCQLGTKHYLHLIKDYRESFDGTIQAFQIGNNRGGLNGWVYRNKIYGRVIKK